ncbi:MAG TPA: enoyl-CoA hydratase-related protein [Acidimicrobiia bacterium]|nr:enoyl-CoA hydratase-related protein [Acidimicrobiia bacterium]
MHRGFVIGIERGDVAVVTIDRPAVLNALDIPTLLELEKAFDSLEHDPTVRAIVVTGAGERAFVAGGDIADLNARRGLAHYREFAEVIHRVIRRIERFPKPTVAAVRGYALGGGVELLLALDVRVLADDAKLGLPEITLGIFPGAGGTQRLIRQVPLCRAKELMFTGDPIGASEAVALGLANRVVPAADLLGEARRLAERMARHSPLVLSLLKRTLNEGAEMPPSAALAYEQAMIGLVFDTEDAHEGCTAFLERRAASFKGV